VATAHGNALDNLIKNPTLSDLVGGIQSVTLGDEEARRRRTQKTVLERAAEPTFPLAVEMHSRRRWLVHADVAATVDALLRGQAARPQVRELGEDGRVSCQDGGPAQAPAPVAGVARLRPLPRALPRPQVPSARSPAEPAAVPMAEPRPQPLRVFGAGIPPRLLEQGVRSRCLAVLVVAALEDADVVLSVRQHLGRDPHVRRQARERGLPILVIKSTALPQLQRALERLLERHRHADAPPATGPLAADDPHGAMEECRLAVEQVVLATGQPVELLPRSEAIRRMQAELAARYRLRTAVFGQGEQQRLRVFPA
jgi:hypothetical protein